MENISASKFYSFITIVVEAGDYPFLLNIFVIFCKNLQWLQYGILRAIGETN
jgi:hypothetical protein